MCKMSDKDKAREAKKRICSKCQHEQCFSSLCPLENVTFEKLLNFYEYGQFNV